MSTPCATRTRAVHSPCRVDALPATRTRRSCGSRPTAATSAGGSSVSSRRAFSRASGRAPAPSSSRWRGRSLAPTPARSRPCMRAWRPRSAALPTRSPRSTSRAGISSARRRADASATCWGCPAGGVVALHRRRISSLDETRKRCAEALAAGFRQVQVKVGTASWRDDVTRIEASVEALGDVDRVIVDANGFWPQADAVRVVAAVDQLDIYVEQPCASVAECAQVRRSSPAARSSSTSLDRSAGDRRGAPRCRARCGPVEALERGRDPHRCVVRETLRLRSGCR